MQTILQFITRKQLDSFGIKVINKIINGQNLIGKILMNKNDHDIIKSAGTNIHRLYNKCFVNDRLNTNEYVH